MISAVLTAARARIDRYSPAEAAASDSLIVDIRCTDARARDGIVPGSVHIPRSVLEWRCDRSSGYANEHVLGKSVILLCEHGYSSSLAAASLRHLGVQAGDVDGGFEAWVAAGLPTAPAPAVPEGLPGMGGPE